MGKTKNLAAKIPLIFILTGAAFCAALVIKSLSVSGGTFDYYRHVLSHQIYQTILFICIECGTAAVWFEFLRIKTEKSE
ncbi:MAG: hypothetical protein IKL42_02445 [Clostridia bacterium]|nr:hypothetical protein [Clostridia bacterium]MBR3576244.1 hypothetical protein [Clostridia bacterium]